MSVTNKICPFLVSPPVAADEYKENGSSTSLSLCVMDRCQLWDAEHEDCGANNLFINNDIANLTEHIHQSHWHRKGHQCEDRTQLSECGGFAGADRVGYAVMLVNEFMSMEDFDDNEKIYGLDWRIKDTDNKPPMLDQLETHPRWPEPSVDVSWDDYLKFVNGTYRSWNDVPKS